MNCKNNSNKLYYHNHGQFTDWDNSIIFFLFLFYIFYLYILLAYFGSCVRQENSNSDTCPTVFMQDEVRENICIHLWLLCSISCLLFALVRHFITFHLMSNIYQQQDYKIFVKRTHGGIKTGSFIAIWGCLCEWLYLWSNLTKAHITVNMWRSWSWNKQFMCLCESRKKKKRKKKREVYVKINTIFLLEAQWVLMG